jgi:hypothetical protein
LKRKEFWREKMASTSVAAFASPTKKTVIDNEGRLTSGMKRYSIVDIKAIAHCI